MPCYEYSCKSCGYKFEDIQGLKDPVLTKCPKCYKLTLEKLFSKISFKVSGSEKQPKTIKEATKDSQLGSVNSFWERYDQVEKINSDASK